jgi:hypothetical protein
LFLKNGHGEFFPDKYLFSKEFIDIPRYSHIFFLSLGKRKGSLQHLPHLLQAPTKLVISSHISRTLLTKALISQNSEENM